MAKATSKKKQKEFSPEEKLTQHYQGFVQGKNLTTTGEKNFGKTVKPVAKKKA